MLIHVELAASAAEKRRIADFLAAGRAGRTPEMVADLHALMERHGSLDHAREVASALAGAAEHEHARLFGGRAPTRDTEFLAGLIPWVFERT
jgi:geranylgeranyl diphosphate synthase type II